MSDALTRQSLPVSLRRRILARDGHRCFYCGAELPAAGRGAHVDHRHPVRRGGGDEEANLAASCGACNIAKGSMTEAQFLRYVVQRSDAWRTVELLRALLAAYPEWRDVPALWLLIKLAATCGHFVFPGSVQRVIERDGLRPESDPWVQEKAEAAALVLMKLPEARWGRGRHGDGK